MAIELVEVLNGSGAIAASGNTYATIAYAEARFSGRPKLQKWEDIGSEAQKRAMLDAMDELRGRNWIGGLLQETQPEDWPRVAIRPIERRSRRVIRAGYETLTGATGGLYDLSSKFWASTVIPTPLKNAQCDLAFLRALLPSSSDLDSASLSDYKKIVVTVGDIELTREQQDEVAMIRASVQKMIAPFLLSGTQMERG